MIVSRTRSNVGQMTYCPEYQLSSLNGRVKKPKVEIRRQKVSPVGRTASTSTASIWGRA